jgi:hypothetical protein
MKANSSKFTYNVRVKIQPKTLQELCDALVHEWNNIPQAFYPTIDWFYASEMRSCHCCKRWLRTLLNSANLHTAWQFLSVHDLFW